MKKKSIAIDYKIIQTNISMDQHLKGQIFSKLDFTIDP